MADLRRNVSRAFGVPDTAEIVERLDTRLIELIAMQQSAVEQLIVIAHLLDEMARAEEALDRRVAAALGEEIIGDRANG